MELQIVTKLVEELKRNPRNPRRHPASQVKRIADSISRYGFVVPLVVNRENMVLAGHGRLEAAKLLGLEEVPCVILDVEGSDAIDFAVLENRLADLGGWDKDRLRELLDELSDSVKSLLPRVDRVVGYVAPKERLANWNYHWQFVIVYTKHTMEWEHIKTVLKLGRVEYGKGSKNIRVTGTERAIEWVDFVERIQDYLQAGGALEGGPEHED